MRNEIKYLFGFILLIIASVVIFLFISRQAAISQASQECDTFHLMQVESPHNIHASFYLLKHVPDVSLSTMDFHGPNLPVWFVTMDGTWTILGGPPTPEGQPMPKAPYFRKCEVIINAFTNMAIELGAR